MSFEEISLNACNFLFVTEILPDVTPKFNFSKKKYQPITTAKCGFQPTLDLITWSKTEKTCFEYMHFIHFEKTCYRTKLSYFN